MRIYLAGPMRGVKLFNFAAFMDVAMKLRDMGHFVDNPAERDLAVGFDPHLGLDHPDNMAVFDLKSAFEWDFAAVTKCDAVVVLPNWKDSKGVQAELVLARALHRDIFEWVDNDLRPLVIADYTVTFDIPAEHG